MKSNHGNPTHNQVLLVFKQELYLEKQTNKQIKYKQNKAFQQDQ